MEKLINKKYHQFDYKSRYTDVAYYYDTANLRNIYGIGDQINLDCPFVSHKVKPEDTLDSLALKYYSNPTYWWMIAYFNKITDPFMRLVEKFTVIKIPSFSAVTFKNER